MTTLTANRKSRRAAVARAQTRSKLHGKAAARPRTPEAALPVPRLDPSRTGQLRVKAGVAVRARYDRLRTELWRVVVLEDALGLADPPDWFVANVFCPTGEGGGVDPTCGKGDHGTPWPSASLVSGNGDGVIRDKTGQEWQVKHTVKERDGEFKHTYDVLVPGGARGQTAGSADTSWNKNRISSVAVHGEYQRRGLATALYAHIERHLGRKLEENWATTPDGEAFWKSRKRATANEQARDARGRWAAVGGHAVSALQRAGARVGHLEHSVKSYVEDRLEAGVSRLPPSLQSAVRATVHAGRAGKSVLFASWTAGEALAERVSKERGATPEQAKRLRGVLSALDLATFKPISMGLIASGVGVGTAGMLSFIPPASAAYLAYSTARDPMATWRAAKGAVRDAGSYVKRQFTANDLAWNVGEANCGIGPGGFQPGNTCAKGGGSEPPRPTDSAHRAQAKDYVHELTNPHILTVVKLSDVKEVEDLSDKDPVKVAALEKMYRERPQDVPPPLGYFKGKRFVIFEGHHRYLAAKAAGLESFWVAHVYLSDVQKADPRAVTVNADTFHESVVTDALAYLAEHDGDWGFAVLLAAVEEAGGLPEGLELAGAVMGSQPLPPINLVLTDNALWSVLPTADRLRAFGGWLKDTAADLWRGLEETLRGITELAIRRGAGRSFDEARAGHFLDPNFRPAARDQFLDSLGRDPANRQRFDALRKRIGDEAVNHRDSVVEKVERSISDAVVNDRTPQQAWKEIATVIDRERNSAVTTVNDEIVRDHAEGQIAGFEEAGVVELFPLLEWTVHPERSKSGVCPRCWALRGTRWTVSDARGKIPLHRNCKCSWSAVPAEDRKKKSYAPAPSRYKRNEATENVFCPTGEGGGIDPTCSPGGSGPLSAGDVTHAVVGDRKPHPGSRALGPSDNVDNEDADERNLLRANTAYELKESELRITHAEQGHVSKQRYSRDADGDNRILNYMADRGHQVMDPGEVVARGLAFDSEEKAVAYLRKTLAGGWFETRKSETALPESFAVGRDRGEEFATRLARQVTGRGDRNAHGVVLEVEPNARKRVRGVRLDYGEGEFLLPRGQAYRVESVVKEELGGFSTYRVRMVHDVTGPTTNAEGSGCGTGAGGFKPGNTCAGGGASSSGFDVAPGSLGDRDREERRRGTLREREDREVVKKRDDEDRQWTRRQERDDEVFDAHQERELDRMERDVRDRLGVREPGIGKEERRRRWAEYERLADEGYDALKATQREDKVKFEADQDRGDRERRANRSSRHAAEDAARQTRRDWEDAAAAHHWEPDVFPAPGPRPTANVDNADGGGNCGIGPDGFLPGNTCARGGGGSSAVWESPSREQLDRALSVGKSVTDGPVSRAMTIQMRGATVKGGVATPLTEKTKLKNMKKIEAGLDEIRTKDKEAFEAFRQWSVAETFGGKKYSELPDEVTVYRGHGLDERTPSATNVTHKKHIAEKFGTVVTEYKIHKDDVGWVMDGSSAFSEGEILIFDTGKLRKSHTTNTDQGGNCGVGAGGFLPGNTCGKGGGPSAPRMTNVSGLSDLAEKYRETAWYNGNGGRKAGADLPEAKRAKVVRSYAAQVLAAERAGHPDVAHELVHAAPRLLPGTRLMGTAGATEPYDGGRHEGVQPFHKGNVLVLRPGIEYPSKKRPGVMGSGRHAVVIRARVEPAGGAVGNVFCPTGEGGGVDPTCSKGGTGVTSAEVDAVKQANRLSDRHLIFGKFTATHPDTAKEVIATLERLADEYGLPEGGVHVIELKGGSTRHRASMGIGTWVKVSKEEATRLKAAGTKTQVIPAAGGGFVHQVHDLTAHHIHLYTNGSKTQSGFNLSPAEFTRVKAKSDGWTVSTGRGGAADTVTHEFGHSLDYRAHGEGGRKGPVPTGAGTISRYATTKLAEATAEAFVKYTTGDRSDLVISLVTPILPKSR